MKFTKGEVNKRERGNRIKKKARYRIHEKDVEEVGTQERQNNSYANQKRRILADINIRTQTLKEHTKCTPQTHRRQKSLQH